MDDAALLQAYVRDGSEIAFREIVARHVALVYSAAYRKLNEPALAEDVSQVVFITLARKAGQFPKGVLLAGWLYRTALFVAARTCRGEERRRRREREAVQMLNQAPETQWEDVAPFLDEGMAQLRELDRNVILLRYFKNRSLREVGRALGISEDNAQKRVSRAVEKLRTFFWKKRVAVPAFTLTSLMSTNAAQLAPPNLEASIAAVCGKHATVTAPVHRLAEEAARQAIPRTAWPTIPAPLTAAAAIAAAAALLIYVWPARRAQAPSWTLDSRIVAHVPPAPIPRPAPALAFGRLPASNPPLLGMAPQWAAEAPGGATATDLSETNLPVVTAGPSNTATVGKQSAPWPDGKTQRVTRVLADPRVQAPMQSAPYSASYYFPPSYIGQGVIFSPTRPVLYTNAPPQAFMRFPVGPVPPRGYRPVSPPSVVPSPSQSPGRGRGQKGT